MCKELSEGVAWVWLQPVVCTCLMKRGFPLVIPDATLSKNHLCRQVERTNERDNSIDSGQTVPWAVLLTTSYKDTRSCQPVLFVATLYKRQIVKADWLDRCGSLTWGEVVGVIAIAPQSVHRCVSSYFFKQELNFSFFFSAVNERNSG